MENNYPRLVKPQIVQMLELLFPGLKKCASNVPQWEDSDSPWMIFSTDGNNIIRQIVELTGSEEGVFIHPFVVVKGDLPLPVNLILTGRETGRSLSGTLT